MKRGAVVVIFAALFRSVASTLVDFLQGAPDFTILVDLLVAANLVDDLRAPGPFTVFAPANFAFDNLQDFGPELFDALLSSPAWQLHLRDLLWFHVTSGEFQADALRGGITLTMLNGEIINIMDTLTPVVEIVPAVGDAPANGILGNFVESNGYVFLWHGVASTFFDAPFVSLF